MQAEVKRCAVAGVAALVAALAAGHVVAAVVDPAASPAVAAAGAVVDLTPSAIVEWAKHVFGTHTKTALALGMTLVLTAFALVTGLVARRNRTAAYALVGVLAAVGFVAVLTRPAIASVGLLAPVVSGGVGVVTLRFLLGRVEEPSEPVGNRRQFLLTAGAVTLGAVAAGGLAQLLAGPNVEASRRAVAGLRPRRKAPPIPAGADFAAEGTPSMITPNDDFYTIHTAISPPRIAAEDWRLRIHGMVEKPLTLTFDDLRRRPLVERTLTLACVSNPVGGDLVSTATFVGVDLADLLADAGVQHGAEQLFSTSEDGFTAETELGPVLDKSRGAMLALLMNGEPLPLQHGFPVRMIVPGLYGFVSATKWLVDLEVTTWSKRTAYWTPRGWARKAPVKTQSRIDRAEARDGRLTVAGTAWAPPHGIKAVQVRIDDGPWRTAELAAEVNRNTWRMWRAVLPIAPGDHRVTCRATDNTGYTQTADRAAEAPDGATGWHSVDVQ